MNLKEICQPVKRELDYLEQVLETSLSSSRYETILKMGNYLLDGGGKRLRPALVLLSAKATNPTLPPSNRLINIAAAMELIHMASLVHDDVIDHSKIRHSRPTVNRKAGEEVAIALGDYLYSAAFELIASCDNRDVLQSISSAAKAMCEGELLQVCERDNLGLLRDHYFIIVKKKTAALFASSCQSGGLLASSPKALAAAFGEYGLNFGIAFQIVDDCLDLIVDSQDLGKSSGNDFKLGELTLPLLNLMAVSKDKNRVLALMESQSKEGSFEEIKQRFISSSAFSVTKKNISSYIEKARDSLKILEDSRFKDSLNDLAAYIGQRLKL